MADDIVTRLQDQAQAPALAWLTEAADEIERLRAAGDALADWCVYRHIPPCNKIELRRGLDCTCGHDKVMNGWNNARKI